MGIKITRYSSNAACILDYLSLFRALAEQEPDETKCQAIWESILNKERSTGKDVLLAPRELRRRFRLGKRDFLLVMAALALEADGGLRANFRRNFALNFPTIEYGLQLISLLCPAGVETLADLAGYNPVCELLVTGAKPTSYPLERPLILCRAALAFLTGPTLPRIPGTTVLPEKDMAVCCPIHEEAYAQICSWHSAGGKLPLYLLAPAGSGRRTLLCRACKGAVCLEMGEVSLRPLSECESIYQEAVVMAILQPVPLCVVLDRGRERVIPPGLLRLCQRYQVPLVVLAGEDSLSPGAGEAVRLPRQLRAEEKARVWRSFVPNTRPDAIPDGAISVGNLHETAELALRCAAEAGREEVCLEDVQRAMRRRSGAMEFGILFDLDAAFEDMVLPESVMEQLRLICQAARSGAKLAEWGIPRQQEGVAAVFYGPSGTGKTMAATAIAGQLGMPLLRADLSQIMDRYVGETEKHLARLLQSARENRCVLLFDEADALFGKRAAVSTAQDKYANLSTSYLLQEIERYDGVVLLSTNLLSNFDDAFLRRLHYLVGFSLPDAGLREQLWRRALPPDRLEGEIPFALLAQAELSPARIFAAARGAAIAAMESGAERMDAGTVMRALRFELEKNGKKLPQKLVAFSV